MAAGSASTRTLRGGVSAIRVTALELTAEPLPELWELEPEDVLMKKVL
jgi:hypothetical protein